MALQAQDLILQGRRCKHRPSYCKDGAASAGLHTARTALQAQALTLRGRRCCLGPTPRPSLLRDNPDYHVTVRLRAGRLIKVSRALNYLVPDPDGGFTPQASHRKRHTGSVTLEASHQRRHFLRHRRRHASRAVSHQRRQIGAESHFSTSCVASPEALHVTHHLAPEASRVASH